MSDHELSARAAAMFIGTCEKIAADGCPILDEGPEDNRPEMQIDIQDQTIDPKR